MNQIDRETYKEIHKVYIEDIFKGTCWTISDCRYVKPPARKWLIIRSFSFDVTNNSFFASFNFNVSTECIYIYIGRNIKEIIMIMAKLRILFKLQVSIGIRVICFRWMESLISSLAPYRIVSIRMAWH